MKTYINPGEEQWEKLCERPVIDKNSLIPTVQNILDKVSLNGNKALKEYTEQFDGFTTEELKVSAEEIQESYLQVPQELKLAIQKAAANIERFHSEQQANIVKTETTPGVFCWQKPLPIEKIGLYIPGGSAPLFSSVLMLAIPAKVAGCPKLVMCTPADGNGKINPAILYAAKLTGVSEIYKIGGAQAIGAMAYGTETIPKVDKIFGPGNQYVTMAKQLVSSQGVAIDMPAGPSEVLVVCDKLTPAMFVAADLLSQAEHGADSQVMLLTTDENTLLNIKKSVENQLKKLPRKEIARKALQNARFIVFDNQQDLMKFSNTYAPEHLILATENAFELAELVRNAGSVFIGKYTPESAGDYASGTNHTLPTNGFAKAWSGVNLDSYYKKITFQQITANGLLNLSKTVEVMAKHEGLEAHKKAVSTRVEYIKEQQKENSFIA
jgi:histidinol dehydrogenase